MQVVEHLSRWRWDCRPENSIIPLKRVIYNPCL
ncbi:hypothetical protein V6Z12_A07G080600 [Gossypium hirsutum]